ncbi:DUF1611 domain-containing protein [Longimycelium tulufanense]|uniref:DUF1611 domain-containing protein n=1 Tax=Longimycelium tulufanense TaxID=907463 RepID=A0A8J3FW95_9PSEU|nr:DUF1611 domain-containing protein [Longimycelium tulufanense]GGM57845.1 DUF1611 domain-containing protein [Longimycelium tulufanense]
MLPAFAADRVARWKVAYSVRRVDLNRPLALATHVPPRHGDLVLARVTAVGQHVRLELTAGRRAELYPGDEIVVGYGTRYSPDQFEAELPTDLSPCHLVAAGGIAALVNAKHSRMATPTALEPVGLLATPDGSVLNVAEGALPDPPRPHHRVPTVLVAGTAMNAGKSTTVSSLARGLTRAGLRVGACKITGTGAGGDRYSYVDAGAAEVLDFTDLGLVSTYRVPVPRLADIAVAMHGHLVAGRVQVALIEIADGLLCTETAELLGHPALHDLVDGVILAAGDAAGTVTGVRLLRQSGHRVLGASGLFTSSPLATREARAALDVPVHLTHELSSPAVAGEVLASVAPGIETSSGGDLTEVAALAS